MTVGPVARSAAWAEAIAVSASSLSTTSDSSSSGHHFAARRGLLRCRLGGCSRNVAVRLSRLRAVRLSTCLAVHPDGLVLDAVVRQVQLDRVVLRPADVVVVPLVQNVGDGLLEDDPVGVLVRLQLGQADR